MKKPIHTELVGCGLSFDREQRSPPALVRITLKPTSGPNGSEDRDIYLSVPAKQARGIALALLIQATEADEFNAKREENLRIIEGRTAPVTTHRLRMVQRDGEETVVHGDAKSIQQLYAAINAHQIAGGDVFSVGITPVEPNLRHTD